MEIRFKPIGMIHTRAGADDVKAAAQEGELEIFARDAVQQNVRPKGDGNDFR